MAIKYPYKQYPREVIKFRAMLDRAHQGYCDTSWKRTTKSFWSFLKAVGPIPKHMKDPSLGRKDHSKGYLPGNVKWQDRRENNGEPWSRAEVQAIQRAAREKLFNRPGIREHYAVMMKERTKKIWTKAQRKRQSLRMKGNQYASHTY